VQDPEVLGEVLHGISSDDERHPLIDLASAADGSQRGRIASRRVVNALDSCGRGRLVLATILPTILARH
jgi:hypothetical protein